MVSTGLTGSSLTLTDTKGAGSYALIGGFQIVQTGAVPEPSTWVLLGLGSAGLLGLTLRQRRLHAA